MAALLIRVKLPNAISLQHGPQLEHTLEEPEASKDARRVGRDLDAGADVFDCRDSFEDGDFVAGKLEA